MWEAPRVPNPKIRGCSAVVRHLGVSRWLTRTDQVGAI